jgi:hypothetical protein
MPPASLTLRLHRLLALAACVSAISCGASGLFKELEKEQAGIAGETSRIAGMTRRSATMSWKQARERLLKEELSLRQAEARLAELQRQRKNQWREWLPRPTFYLNLQKSLQELGDFSGDDISAALYAPLTIPNPWSQTALAYQYALQEVQAADSLELSRRRQVIALYRLFADWDRLESPAPSDAASLDQQVQSALRARENEAMADERRQLSRGQLSRMLNLPETEVTPRPETLPRIDYEAGLARLVPGKNYGRLATRLASYEIQAALLRRKGVSLTEWPAPNFNASIPPVYDTRRDGGQFVESADQISLFGSWAKSYDITGREAANIRSAEENVAYVRQSLRVKLDAEGRAWDRLRGRYRMLIEKRALLRERLAATLRGGASAGSASESLESARRLMADLANLERAKRELDMEVWLWDDEAWK